MPLYCAPCPVNRKAIFRCDPGLPPPTYTVRRAALGERRQLLTEPLRRGEYDYPAMLEVVAPGVGRVADVREASVIVTL
jgi:hypothetical protein